MVVRNLSQVLLPGLGASLARAFKQLPNDAHRFAVALSGGADSAMLAVHAAHFAALQGKQVYCFHIHHGLQQQADDWLKQSHLLARMLGIPCISRKVSVGHVGRDGIEAAARTARYRAFSELAELTGLRHILLAHHQDDQAETVLLRLLRGAGPAALGAMAPLTVRDGLHFMRPWLDQRRSDILEQSQLFASLTDWCPVHDPSNAQDRYTRSALRERIVPQLNARWPGWQGTLARHARQSREIASLLDHLASSDFQALDPDADVKSFSLQAWRALPSERQALVLRYWLGLLSIPMPSDARLADWMRQLRGLHQLGSDRSMQARHAGWLIRCTQGRVRIDPAQNQASRQQG